MKAIRTLLVGAIAGMLFPLAAQSLWWDQHPGSELRFAREFPWWCVAGLLLAGVGYLTIFYVREYRDVFLGASEEEHNGLQR